ncbi:MAG: PP2C family protein-serine/threonine phosphatase [Candidatus Alkaliphilus sp. MAG34]|nr:serine/threonine-protein phosphatase [Clostridiales bacterium]
MGDKKEINLFFDIYDLAFDAAKPEIFNDIVEKVVAYLGASSCSLWINNPEIAGTETKLGYYNNGNDKDISQLDYGISCRTMASKEPNINKAVDGQKNKWFYISYPFGENDLTGCFTIWFEENLENDFRQSGEKIKGLAKLAVIIKNVVSHFLTYKRFDYKRIIQELSAAEKIQSSLVPTKKPDIPNVGIGARSLVANEVGGDYLDLIQLDNGKLGIAVGDAMGMGIPGAFVMLTARAIFRLLAKSKAEPEEILGQLNICLTPELIQQNMFISLFYGVYNPQNRNLKYAVAGHNPPIIFRRSNRKMEDLEGRGLVIGGKHQISYNSFNATLEKGDLMIIYTDGVKDIRNKSNKSFGAEGIKRVLSNYVEYDAEGISNCLAHALVKYCNNQLNDDASFIILKAE